MSNRSHYRRKGVRRNRGFAAWCLIWGPCHSYDCLNYTYDSISRQVIFRDTTAQACCQKNEKSSSPSPPFYRRLSEVFRIVKRNFTPRNSATESIPAALTPT